MRLTHLSRLMQRNRFLDIPTLDRAQHCRTLTAQSKTCHHQAVLLGRVVLLYHQPRRSRMETRPTR